MAFYTQIVTVNSSTFIFKANKFNYIASKTSVREWNWVLNNNIIILCSRALFWSRIPCPSLKLNINYPISPLNFMAYFPTPSKWIWKFQHVEFHSIPQTYYQARVGTLDKLGAKNKLLYTLSQPQSIIVNCFPVKQVPCNTIIKSIHIIFVSNAVRTLIFMASYRHLMIRRNWFLLLIVTRPFFARRRREGSWR